VKDRGPDKPRRASGDNPPPPGPRPDPRGKRSTERTDRRRPPKPPLRVFTTTLWEYPSQHYETFVTKGGEGSGVQRTQAAGMQGDQAYVGATPSWVIWQLLMRYTREKDLVVDPMCGSGTTLDVARDLSRRALGYDLAPSRSDIFRADARKLPLENEVADFVFIDPPYSTHVNYSDDPACIGKLDAASDAPDSGRAYYAAMEQVFREIHRILKNRRYMAVYVSDSWRKRKGPAGEGAGVFMPIGFELFSILRQRFRPVDIIAVVRHNEKLTRGNWNKAAEEGNFFLRGFNYLMIFKKQD
jgi:adenine-specific DNA-methyltransferase